MTNINAFKNIDVNKIQAHGDYFRLRLLDDYIELFRINKHFWRTPSNPPKWVTFPLNIKLVKGKKYSLCYNVFSTYKMDRSFFLFSNGKMQIFDNTNVPKDTWTSKEIIFESELDKDAVIAITVSDLPIGGNYFLIKELSLKEI